MNMSLDDPRLTAYALGELPEAERAVVESFLERSEEARRLVAEIKETGGLLENELALEPAIDLQPEQREAIEVRAKVKEELTPTPASPVLRLFAYAAAACVVGVLGYSMFVPTMSSRRQSEAAAKEAMELAQLEMARAYTEKQTGKRIAPPYTPSLTPTPVEPQMHSLEESELPAMTFSMSSARPVDYDVSDVEFTRRNGNGNLRDSYTLVQPGSARHKSTRLSLVNGQPATPANPYRRDPSAVSNPEGTAVYSHFPRNSFQEVLKNPLTTFSIDVDTASYANVRRFLNEGRMPPADAVRIEEMVNYFSYNYESPEGDRPFSANIEVAGCPWNSEHRLVRVALKGKEMDREERPSSNLVFLMDVSGSMSPENRLPLVKQSLRMLVKHMNENDRVAIVVYAGAARVHLESTSCELKEKILAAIDRLSAGGSTNGGDGIQQAYDMAAKHFIRDGVNRVILCTDGDFNTGVTDRNRLVDMAKRKSSEGIFLTVLGVGTDNYKDALMQRLGDEANGNYHYLDTVEEGHKVLVQQMNANLVTIAKDVKIQIEFNPSQVGAYRLVGYEKRVLANRDFHDDTKDAGEIGAGHAVTAFYEIIPPKDGVIPVVGGSPLKYQRPAAPAKVLTESEELLTLKLRYKEPDGHKSKLSEFAVVDEGKRYSQASEDFRFAAAVASFGMILRGSEYKGSASYEGILELAGEAKGEDPRGYRAEFVNLVEKARGLSGGR